MLTEKRNEKTAIFRKKLSETGTGTNTGTNTDMDMDMDMLG